MEELRTKGIQVTGYLADRTVSSGKSTTYKLTYQVNYQAVPYEYRETTDEDTYNATRIGDPAIITLFPSKPRDGELGIVDRDRVAATQFNCGMGIVVVCIGLGIAIWFTRFTIKSQCEILRDWECHAMYITDVKSTSAGKSGQTYTLTLRCESAPERGRDFHYKVTSPTSPGLEGHFLTVLLGPSTTDFIRPLDTLTMASLMSTEDDSKA